MPFRSADRSARLRAEISASLVHIPRPLEHRIRRPAPAMHLHPHKETVMRILMASVSLIAAVVVSGCATFQKYPAFGNAAGAGQVVEFDRQGANNLVPHSKKADRVTVPQSRYSVIR
jgi:hypothetical protein